MYMKYIFVRKVHHGSNPVLLGEVFQYLMQYESTLTCKVAIELIVFCPLVNFSFLSGNKLQCQKLSVTSSGRSCFSPSTLVVKSIL